MCNSAPSHRICCANHPGGRVRLPDKLPRDIKLAISAGTLTCAQLTPLHAGAVALELYEALTGLQQEKTADPFGWVVPVC